MKKHTRKLNLNKRTISNLSTPEMTELVGGAQTNNCFTDLRCTRGCGNTVTGCPPTYHGNTCNGNNC